MKKNPSFLFGFACCILSFENYHSTTKNAKKINIAKNEIHFGGHVINLAVGYFDEPLFAKTIKTCYCQFGYLN